ncbi:MAG TPA: amidohydrolase family protein, partial [Clostridiales bacterium]|nr:amidohydrolase family protein [Clostridiales bacterium]
SADICTISPAVPYTLFDESVSHCGDLGRLNGSVVFEGIIACAKACLENGIPVGIGTDTGCPFIRHYDMWRELQYFHLWCGVSNQFALYTATKRNAEIVKIDNDVGTIEPGKFADFIVCAKNPLDDLKVLRKLDMVVKGGVVYDNPQIKKDPEIDAALDKFIDFTPEDYAKRKAEQA